MKSAILHGVLWLLCVAGFAFGDNLTITNSFPGDSAIGPKTSPDNVGAVGPEHVVDLTCANFVVHDKRTGKVLQKKTQVEFWKDLGIPDVIANDPRMLYDPLAQRWIATTAFDGQHHLLLAVSTSADPTKPWKGVQTTLASPDFGFRCGVDKNGFYGCYWNYTKDTHTMMDCVAVRKEDLFAANGPDLSNQQLFHGIEIESFPATDLNPDKPADAPEILLNREFGNSFAKLYLYMITWDGKKAAISEKQIIPLGRTYVSPNGSSQKNMAIQPAPGPKLRADESRRTECVYRFKDSLFTCNEAKRDPASRCGIFWAEVSISQRTVLQQGLIDSPDCDYLAPSLAVDQDGNVGIGCTRTSEKEFPSVCVIARKASDPKNTMGDPVIAVNGTTIFTSAKPGKYGVPWGNYNATCLDPSDRSIIWTTQEYSASGVPEQFNAHWVAFKVK